jgi:hypothetical protein
MPVITPTGMVIRNVVACLAISPGAADPDLLFDDELQPTPRLLARPGCDPAALVLAVTTGAALRCAAAPHRLVDLDQMRQRATRIADRRYRRWRRRPDSVDLRAWERTLLQQGRAAFVEYHRLRSVAADALVPPDGDPICAQDTSMPQRLRYAQAANRLLDQLPGDTLLMSATI